MPITQERLHDLLIEHEHALNATRDLLNTILDTIRDRSDLDEITGQSNYGQTDAQRLESKLNLIRMSTTAHNTALDSLSIIARQERKIYNSTIKQNVRAKEKMRLRRRRAGVPERWQPGAPDEVAERMRMDDEYAAFNRGEGEHERKLTNEEFLATLPAPEKPKSDEELGAQFASDL